MEFDLENPLTNFEDNNNNDAQYPSFFRLESEHMVPHNYAESLINMDLNISLRRETISLILQQAKQWVVRLLATACVSLAAKMMKTEFRIQDVQCGEGFIFDSLTIERMELIILGALRWRMRSITPFSFLDFFISLFKLKDPPLRQSLKARALEIIFKAQDEIKLLEFKPSIVAASALVSASHELFPMQCACFRKAISTCSYVNEEKLSSCCSVIQRIVMEGYASVFDVAAGGGAASSSDTPANVLDQRWSSSTSSDLTIKANTNHPGEIEAKRQRKIVGSCNHSTPRPSQIQHCS
ncbi:hypothetical protein Nepgr_000478 [Nepenthes gracilis]|uniref:Cyclin C-terminal domain-containing protein n=1 Tax=Nepenthes gracilis TaxID=150966 RepID=A0AAD3RW93_NEPGR|nr:hypothetical protein Nepgr_000478 [Nepenthes gracilis]